MKCAVLLSLRLEDDGILSNSVGKYSRNSKGSIFPLNCLICGLTKKLRIFEILKENRWMLSCVYSKVGITLS